MMRIPDIHQLRGFAANWDAGPSNSYIVGETRTFANCVGMTEDGALLRLHLQHVDMTGTYIRSALLFAY